MRHATVGPYSESTYSLAEFKKSSRLYASSIKREVKAGRPEGFWGVDNIQFLVKFSRQVRANRKS